jgi:penicillin V acylase-like amidase (Ntn superfamily)
MKQNNRHGSVLNLTFCAVLFVAPLQSALACTRVLWNDNELAVVVARTMDWPESTQPMLTVSPRGIQRDGGRFGKEIVVADNPARWTSKYGSLVTTAPNVIWVDLAKFNFEPGAPVIILDPDDIDLSGNVSAKFQKIEKPPF